MPFIDDTWLRNAMRALKATLDVDNRLKSQMVQFLFDEGFWDKEKLSWDSAIARFNACLNPSKAEFFKLGEIWALMVRFQRHDLFLAMGEDLGYECRLRPSEERRQVLLERIAVATEQYAETIASSHALLQRMEAPVPQPATGIIPGQRAQFSLGESHGSAPPTAVGRIGCP